MPITRLYTDEGSYTEAGEMKAREFERLVRPLFQDPDYPVREVFTALTSAAHYEMTMGHLRRIYERRAQDDEALEDALDVVDE